MSDVITGFLMQMLWRLPMLLAYLAGIVAAIACWRRCPTAAVLVLLGSGTSLLISVVGAIAFQYIIHSRDDWGWSAEKMGTVINMVALANGVIGAISFALVLTAVFVGRRG